MTKTANQKYANLGITTYSEKVDCNTYYIAINDLNGARICRCFTMSDLDRKVSNFLCDF